jgi:hypothetical protein
VAGFLFWGRKFCWPFQISHALTRLWMQRDRGALQSGFSRESGTPQSDSRLKSTKAASVNCPEAGPFRCAHPSKDLQKRFTKKDTKNKKEAKKKACSENVLRLSFTSIRFTWRGSSPSW